MLQTNIAVVLAALASGLSPVVPDCRGSDFWLVSQHSKKTHHSRTLLHVTPSLNWMRRGNQMTVFLSRHRGGGVMDLSRPEQDVQRSISCSCTALTNTFHVSTATIFSVTRSLARCFTAMYLWLSMCGKLIWQSSSGYREVVLAKRRYRGARAAPSATWRVVTYCLSLLMGNRGRMAAI